MHRVYSIADRVLVWLGEAGDGSDDVMDALEGNTNRVEAMRGDTARRQIVDAVLSRPWWDRVWIIQEVALAESDPIILCGRKQVSWDKFMAGCVHYGLGCFPVHKTEPRRIKSTYCRVRLEKVRTELQSWPSCRLGIQYFCWLLSRTKNFTASDPRDKIYGCLGLLQQEVCDSILPDYRKSTVTVYLDTTKQILAGNHSTFFFDFSLYSPGRKSGPSWVPDFADQETASSRNPRFMTFAIIGPTPPTRHVSFEDNDSLLIIEGFMFDTIVTSVELKPYDQLLLQIEELDMVAERAAKTRLPPLHVFQSLKRDADVVELLCNDAACPPSPDVDSEFRRRYQYLACQAGVSSRPEGFFSPAEIARWEKDSNFTVRAPLMRSVPGRYFFVTSLGFVGFCVGRALVGDAVVALGGEDMPTVLRP